MVIDDQSRDAEGELICPDENEIAALVQGLLAEREILAIEKHIDRCVKCRNLFVHLARELSPLELPPGNSVLSFGRYEVKNHLGTGAMGVVNLAFDPKLNRKVALKVIRPDLLITDDSQRHRKRLLREARQLATVQHPNVLSVHDVGTVDDQLFVAFEYIEGQTLKQWLRENKFTIRTVVELFIQIGYGIGAVHRSGLVHRDIKPDNILVGHDGRVKVADFGLATHSKETERSSYDTYLGFSSLSHTAGPAGTPAYMAPEVFSGVEPNEKSDQFSFCVSLFESLHGKLPYSVEDLVALANDQNHRVSITKDQRKVPRLLGKIIRRGLELDPQKRFPDMDSLVSKLERAISRSRKTLLLIGTIGLLSCISLFLAIFGEFNGVIEDSPHGDHSGLKTAHRSLPHFEKKSSKNIVSKPNPQPPIPAKSRPSLLSQHLSSTKKREDDREQSRSAKKPLNTKKREKSILDKNLPAPTDGKLKNEASQKRLLAEKAYLDGSYKTCLTHLDKADALDKKSYLSAILRGRCRSALEGSPPRCPPWADCPSPHDVPPGGSEKSNPEFYGHTSKAAQVNRSKAQRAYLDRRFATCYHYYVIADRLDGRPKLSSPYREKCKKRMGPPRNKNP